MFDTIMSVVVVELNDGTVFKEFFEIADDATDQDIIDTVESAINIHGLNIADGYSYDLIPFDGYTERPYIKEFEDNGSLWDIREVEHNA